MARQRLSGVDYWTQHVDRLVERYGLGVDQPVASHVLTVDGDPYHCVIESRLWLDHGSFIDVYEVVKIDTAGRPRRIRYSYHLSCDGELALREDFAPEQPEPHHRHDPTGDHLPSERISLRAFVDACWEVVAETRLAEPDA